VRGLTPAIRSPHPLGPALPGLYQEDDSAQRFVGAFDDVLAPVFASLDGFEAYIDPWLAPADFVDWLSGWVALALDENWPLERKRTLVARSVELYRIRGTARGLAEHVALVTGVEPEIEESGGVAASTEAGQPLPGTNEPKAVLRLRVPKPDAVDRRMLEALVEAVRPAHLTVGLEIVAA
jgi:phage tail-like protein